MHSTTGETQLRSGVSAVLLAAGAGSRFGGGKLLASYRGRPMIEAVLSELREAPVDEIIAVVGESAGEERERLRRVCSLHGARIAENPKWEGGISTSVKRGLSACAPDSRAAVIVLGDQPLVGAAAVGRLVSAFEDGVDIAAATYGGRQRNPVLFARSVWPILQKEISGDKGARRFLREHTDLVTEVPCDEVADPADVDTVEDLRSLEARGAGEQNEPEGG
ncbi:nucleotidyltransferase family protein [soil metagenome]|nr:nucleotidyltransferase family protein [Rubrobacter sp.]